MRSSTHDRGIRAAFVAGARRTACVGVVAAAAAVLAGCATYAAYDGGTPPDAAVIQADPRVTAGLPMAVAIRRVDDRAVGAQFSRVKVAPGRHVVLVDCTMASSRAITRHELQVEVEPRGRYRLVAEAAPGNQRCGDVRIEAR